MAQINELAGGGVPYVAPEAAPASAPASAPAATSGPVPDARPTSADGYSPPPAVLVDLRTEVVDPLASFNALLDPTLVPAPTAETADEELPRDPEPIDDPRVAYWKARIMAEPNVFNPSVFESASPEEKRDPLLAAELLAFQSGVLGYLDPALQHDRDFLVSVIGRNGAVILSAPELYADREALTAALATYPAAFSSAVAWFANEYGDARAPLPGYDPRFDAALVGLAAQKDPSLLAGVPEAVVIEAVSDLVAEDVAAFRGLPVELQGNPELAAACARKNALLLLDPTVAGLLLSEARAGAATARELGELKAELLTRLEALGTRFPERFASLHTLDEIEHNRAELATGARTRLDGTPDTRPLAVVLYPSADATHAFQASWNELDELAAGYRLVYVELSLDTEFVPRLRELTRQGADPAELLVVGGHGTQTFMSLSVPFDGELGQALGLLSDVNNLGVGDALDLLLANPGALVKPGANVVLESCSTGQGGAGALNVANLFATIFPQADIWAPTVPTNAAMRLSDTGLFVDPGLPADIAYHVPRAR